MKGRLVCFTGIDGAGKTTLAQMVASHLQDQGLEAVYVYCRYSPRLMKPLLFLSRHLITGREDFYRDYSSYSEVKRKTSSKHPLLSRIYRRFLMIDYADQVRSKVSLPLNSGKLVVCDRYVFDTIATDLAIDFSLTDEEIKDQVHQNLRRFPSPDVTFLVDVPPEVAVQRKDDIPSIDYVQERKRVYELISREHEMTTLNGQRPTTELLRMVCNMLEVAGLV